MFLMPLSTKCFLCNSNIGNVLVTSEFFFYWKLLYTICLLYTSDAADD